MDFDAGDCDADLAQMGNVKRNAFGTLDIWKGCVPRCRASKKIFDGVA